MLGYALGPCDQRERPRARGVTEIRAGACFQRVSCSCVRGSSCPPRASSCSLTVRREWRAGLCLAALWLRDPVEPDHGCAAVPRQRSARHGLPHGSGPHGALRPRFGEQTRSRAQNRSIGSIGAIHPGDPQRTLPDRGHGAPSWAARMSAHRYRIVMRLSHPCDGLSSKENSDHVTPSPSTA